MAVNPLLRRLAAALLAAVLVAGCASAPRGEDPTRELSNTSVMGVEEMTSPTHGETFAMVDFTPDRIQGFNRGSFTFTKAALDWVVMPVAKVWRFVFPEPVREAVGNFAYNITWPDRFVSLLLQGRPVDSAVETGHFLVNTVAGIGGLFDPAGSLGIPTYREDVGQAFARWGFGPGSYLVIPLLGPSSGRDALGRVFDVALNPATYFVGAGAAFNLNALSFRIDGYEALTASEDDLYLPVRALWSIQRQIEIEDYAIPDSAYQRSDPEPSLGLLLARPDDLRFPARARERRVRAPSTGREVPYSLWLQKGQAPLVFLLPGIGSHRGSSAPVLLAERAFERGWSVAVLSSPFHREMLMTGMTSPYPGYTPEDATDLRGILAAIRQQLEGAYPGRITHTCLLGYSLGAIESLFVASQEARAEAAGAAGLRFERVVAINPPVELLHAAQGFDGYFDAPLSWPMEERDRRVRETTFKAFLVAMEGLNGRPLPFTRIESEFLIGLGSRHTLINTLGVVQERTGRGLAIVPEVDPQRGPLLSVVNQSTLVNYLTQLVAPRLMAQRPGTTPEELLHEAGLHGIEPFLQGDPRVRAFTNVDDFILTPDDLAWLEGTLGDRLTVFPGGGHLGNLSLPAVTSAAVEALGPVD